MKKFTLKSGNAPLKFKDMGSSPAKQVATAPSKIPKETFKQGLEKGIGTKLDPWDKMESEVKTPEWMKEKTSDQIKAAKNQPEKVQSWKQSKAMSHKGKSKIKKETFKQGLKKGIGYGLKKVVGPAAIASTGYEIASLVGPMVGVEKGAGYKKFIKPIVDKMSKPKKLDTKAYSKSIEGKKAKQRGKAEAGKQKFIDPTN